MLIHRLTIVLLAVHVAGCVLDIDRERPCLDEASCPDRRPDLTGPPSQANPSILTWNLGWFQDAERGGVDAAVEFDFVLDVIDRSGASLIGLQEVSDADRFYVLIDRLPEYAGVLTDHEWPQQLALLYRARDFQLVTSGVMHGLDDAGRPPLAVELQHVSGARAFVVVLHAKAGNTPNDYARRERFAVGLADRIAQLHGGARVVLGDFNDRLTGSLVSGRSSPYEMLLSDTGLSPPTAALETGTEPSTIWGDTVDHILVDPICLTTALAEAADVLRDELLVRNPHYVEEISDHFPVRLTVSNPRAWQPRLPAGSPR